MATNKNLPMNQRLAKRMDEYMLRLLDEAEMASGQLTIEQRLAVFNSLGKWVAIKNKLMDVMEGEQLNDLRTRLYSGEAPGDTTERTRRANAAKRGYATGNARGLAELKARLPRAGQRGHDGDRDDGGGAPDPAP